MTELKKNEVNEEKSNERGKITIEEKEEGLSVGRYIAGVSRSKPDIMEKLDYLAGVTKTKKTEVVSRAIDLYYETLTLEDVWRRVVRMNPEDLMASWRLFRILMGISADTAITLTKEFVSGTLSTFNRMIEYAKLEAYESARESAKYTAEERRWRQIARIMEKIEPIMDVIFDMVSENMVRIMYPSTYKSRPKITAKVTVEESDGK